MVNRVFGQKALAKATVSRTVMTALALLAASVLAGCAPKASDPNTDPTASQTPSASRAPIKAPDGTPELDGFTLVFAKEYSEAEGPSANSVGAIGSNGAGRGGSTSDPSSTAAAVTPSPQPTTSEETPSSKPSAVASATASPSATLEATESSEPGQIDGAIVAGDYLLAYANDSGSMSHQATAYDLNTGEREWSRVDPGWLECPAQDPAICVSTDYTAGAWQATAASVFDDTTGDLRALEVGHAGTFSLVGTTNHTAYFLTWDGTHAVHMTGFDPSGAPVIDKNLRLDIPAPNEVTSIDAWMGDGRALIAIPGSQPGIYVSSSNAFANYDLSTPCISATDGIACSVTDDPNTLTAIDSVGREKWRAQLDGAELLESGHFAGSLGQLEDQLTSKASDGEEAGGKDSASSKKYLVVAKDQLETATLNGTTLDLGERGTVDLGQAELLAIDFSHATTVLQVALPAGSAGEASAPQIISSILVGPDGKVASQLSESRASQLASEGLSGGEEIYPHTFAWSGGALVLTDETTGLVAVYRAQ